MSNLSKFCTYSNLACPLHPSKHEKGCAPCISKNLQLREIPNCFFDQLHHSEERDGDTFEDFAHLVLECRKQ